MSRVEIIDRELERARLFTETALMVARLELESFDGRLERAAAAGDRLLRDAELAKAGSVDAGL